MKRLKTAEEYGLVDKAECDNSFHTLGVGSILSSFIISAVEKATGGDGRDSWFANTLNKGHLDIF
ncbi:hypothetical protein WN943_008735 [Citrus x changshan-huyou]